MSVLPACMYVHHVNVWGPQRPEEGTESTGTGIANGCESLCRCWETESPSSARAASALI